MGGTDSVWMPPVAQLIAMAYGFYRGHQRSGHNMGRALLRFLGGPMTQCTYEGTGTRQQVCWIRVSSFNQKFLLFGIVVRSCVAGVDFSTAAARTRRVSVATGCSNEHHGIRLRPILNDADKVVDAIMGFSRQSNWSIHGADEMAMVRRIFYNTVGREVTFFVFHLASRPNSGEKRRCFTETRTASGCAWAGLVLGKGSVVKYYKAICWYCTGRETSAVVTGGRLGSASGEIL